MSGFGEDEIAGLLKDLESRERADQVETFDLERAIEEATEAPRSKPGDLWVPVRSCPTSRQSAATRW